MSVTVLLFDEDSDLRDLLCRALEDDGWDVWSVCSAEDALDLLETEPLQVVVLDRQSMENADFDLLDEVRQHVPGAAVILLATLGVDSRELVESTQDLEVDQLLAKPVEPQAFAALVREMLDRHLLRESGEPLDVMSLDSSSLDSSTTLTGQTLESETLDEDIPPVRQWIPSNDSIETIEGLGVADLETSGTELDAVPDEEAPISLVVPEEAEAYLDVQALRDRYRDNLREQFADLEVRLTGLQTQPWDAILLGSAHQMARRILGTSGSYGFRDVAVEVEGLEGMLGGMRNGTVPMDDSTWARLHRTVDHCRVAIARLNQESRDFLHSEDGAGAADGWVGSMLLVGGSARFEGLSGRAERAAIQVLQAKDVETARDVAVGGDVGVVILSDGLVEGNVEALKKLRSNPFLAHTSVVLWTSTLSLTDRVAAVEAGVSLVLDDSDDEESVFAMLRDLLDGHRVQASRILLVHDKPEEMELLTGALRRSGYQVAFLTHAAGLMDVLATSHPDAVIVEHTMPFLGGREICRLLRTEPRLQELPVLVLTRSASAQVRVSLFAAGADDCIAEPIYVEEVIARLDVRLARQHAARSRSVQDSLTHLMTRAAFLEGLRGQMARALRRHRPLSLCLMDVDRLGVINEVRGYRSGDRVLSGLGQLITDSFRTEDILGRWGGDTFVLGFEGEQPGVARTIVERMRAAFLQVGFQGDDASLFHADFSAGVASFPEDGLTAGDLFRAADERLYLAKQAGRGRVFDGSV